MEPIRLVKDGKVLRKVRGKKWVELRERAVKGIWRVEAKRGEGRLVKDGKELMKMLEAEAGGERRNGEIEGE